jgi:uncharacterized spore protein YtfJ
MMKLENLLAQLSDVASARRVFAKPVERDGTTVIPAGVVIGGGGAGTASTNGAESIANAGGGFGVYAFPVGAYVVRDGRVRFKPAVDLNWLALFALMALRIVLRHQRASQSAGRRGDSARRPLRARLGISGRFGT